jgi:hypothetical protein
MSSFSIRNYSLLFDLSEDGMARLRGNVVLMRAAKRNRESGVVSWYVSQSRIDCVEEDFRIVMNIKKSLLTAKIIVTVE